MNTQWKLVPVEPTETMVINGFESEPDECFTDDEVWEQYQEMSGCQQAAFRAKLCWAAMLGSAPSVPTDGQIEVVAVINEEGEIFKETVVEHRPGIDMLPVGTELVDIAHVIRLTAERDALQLRLNAADQRVDHLEGSLRRSASDYEGIDKLLMAFHDENKSQWCGYLDDALGACRYRRSETLNALKPAETERDQGIPGTSFQRLNMLANQGE